MKVWENPQPVVTHQISGKKGFPFCVQTLVNNIFCRVSWERKSYEYVINIKMSHCDA